MKEEHSFIYTLVLGICMLISLLLIGRMLLGHPTPQSKADETHLDPIESSDREAQQIHLSENDLCTLIVQALPFSPDGITIKIGQDATVSLSASIRKQNLLDANIVPGNMRTALLFLPDVCKIYAVWDVSINKDLLDLHCATVEVGGYTLPSAVSSKITEQIAEHLNQQLTDWEIHPSDIQFNNGSLMITSVASA